MNEISSTSNVPNVPGVTSQTLNLDIMRTFVAICETGTFRRAAARVHRSPSAISLQVIKLEEQLGAQLFVRDARRVTLTEKGAAALSYARKLLSLSDEALAVFHGAPLTGNLRIAAPHDLGITLVPNLLRRFADIYPLVVVDVRLDSADLVRRRFLEGDVNIALFNEVRDPGLKVTELYAEPLVWVMKDGGRAVERDPLPLAIAQIECAWRHAALEALEHQNRPIRVAYSSDTSLGQVAALRADLAIAALPISLADDSLCVVPDTYGLPPLPQTFTYLASDNSDLATPFSQLATSMALDNRAARAHHTTSSG
ncbi:MAG: LysR substrate-binding domain-containing protein [Pseudomonadota bacterium]